MAIIKVKAGPKAKADSDGAVLWVERGGPNNGLALVMGDGKSVEVEARHRDVKAALRDGIIVEVKGGGPAKKADDTA